MPFFTFPESPALVVNKIPPYIITITEVIDQTTNQKIKVEDVEAFKDHLVEDNSTHYNDQVEFKEEN